MKRVIFVGLHNKSDYEPLDSATKSGRVIDKIISQIPAECIKTNLYDRGIDQHPDKSDATLAVEWHTRINAYPDDVIVLLGAAVQKGFIIRDNIVIQVPHPAIRGNKSKIDEYIKRVISEIQSKL